MVYLTTFDSIMFSVSRSLWITLTFLLTGYACTLFYYSSAITDSSNPQLFISRLLLVMIFITLFRHFLPNDSLIKWVAQWLNEKQAPYSLAMSRIFIFLLPAIYAFIPESDISNDFLKEWIDLPLSQRKAIPYLEWYSLNVPVNRDIINFIGPIFKLSSIMAFTGLFTRLSTVTYTLIAFYIYSIPNLYGKIGHNHFQLWFPAVMAVSACGDVLSLDYLVKKHVLKKPFTLQRSIRYAQPIKVACLLLGILYFFPGFWKIWTLGFDWIFRMQLTNSLYAKWGQFTHWTPLFRIDYYPILIATVSIFTVVFEAGFVVFQFIERIRPWLALAGFAFHKGVHLFMNINFLSIIPFYAFLINWNHFFKQKCAKAITDEHTKSYVSIPFAIVTGSLILFNTLLGFTKTSSYPFSCFPTFDHKHTDSIDVVIYEGYKNGEVVHHVRIKSALNTERTEHNIAAYERNIIKRNYSKHVQNPVDFNYISQSIHLHHMLDSVSVYTLKRSLNPDMPINLSERIKVKTIIFNRQSN